MNNSFKHNKFYSAIIALLPVVMMYKVPIINVGLSTMLIIITSVFALAVLTKKLVLKRYVSILPIALFLLWSVAKSDIITIIATVCVLLHILAASFGAINHRFLKKVVIFISSLAAICSLSQFFFHSFFNIHIPFIFSDFILDSLSYYKPLINTGLSTGNMYRPSAFFLEPAHMTMYCIVALCFCLYCKRPKYLTSALISAGVLCTTSGMGIVLVAMVWLLLPFFSPNTKLFSKKTLKKIIVLLIILAATIPILLAMPFFQSALGRIIGDYGPSNAIWGRLVKWGEYISPLSGAKLWLGQGMSSIPDNAYFTGLMTIIYAHGIVGAILFYLSIVSVFIVTNTRATKLITGIYGVMVVFADLAGFINLVFYLTISLSAVTVFFDSARKTQNDKRIRKIINERKKFIT